MLLYKNNPKYKHSKFKINTPRGKRVKEKEKAENSSDSDISNSTSILTLFTINILHVRLKNIRIRISINKEGKKFLVILDHCCNKAPTWPICYFKNSIITFSPYVRFFYFYFSAISSPVCTAYSSSRMFLAVIIFLTPLSCTDMSVRVRDLHARKKGSSESPGVIRTPSKTALDTYA